MPEKPVTNAFDALRYPDVDGPPIETVPLELVVGVPKLLA